MSTSNPPPPPGSKGIGSQLAYHRWMLRNAGFSAWLRFYWEFSIAKRPSGSGMGTLHPRGARHPVWFRPGTSDLMVFRQIFLWRSYAFLEDAPEYGLILDLGANAGYASAFMLSRFPRAKLVAVEPDPGNCEMTRRNLAPFGDRATVIQAAVWNRKGRLSFRDASLKPGHEWARQVTEAGETDADAMPAITMQDVLEAAGDDAPKPWFLKMDIEGAEAVVLGTEAHAWIDRFQSLAVEVHDDFPFGNAREALATAIAGRGYATSEQGELTVCTRHE